MAYRSEDRNKYPDVELLHIADNCNGLPFLTVRKDFYANHIHRHEYLQLIYISRGCARHVMWDQAYDVVVGDVIVVPPYEPHYFVEPEGEPQAPFACYELEFTPEFIDERFSEDMEDTGFPNFEYLNLFLQAPDMVKRRLHLTGSARTRIQGLFEAIQEEYDNREDSLSRDSFVLMIKALIMELLVLLTREYRQAIGQPASQPPLNRHEQALNRSIDFIREHCAEDIGIRDAATVAMLSTSYYRYFFKGKTGMTFSEYLNRQRIALAAELLKGHPEKKIIEICLEAGFGNINHFNRTFRQITGVTPGVYRKKAVSGFKPRPAVRPESPKPEPPADIPGR